MSPIPSLAMSGLKYTFVGLVLFCCANAAAQDLRFQHLTTTDGLSDNTITCAFEDREGYIWIGTAHGLNRYDGQRVETFRAVTKGPAGKHISSIAQDGLDRIWITTIDGGLAMRDPRTGKFSNYRHDSTDARSIPTDMLNHVLVWNDTLLFISSRGGGLIRFNPERGMFRTTDHRGVVRKSTGDTMLYADHGWYHTAVRLNDERLWTAQIMNRHTTIIDSQNGSVLSRHPVLGADSSQILTNGLVLGNALYAGGWLRGINRIPLSGTGVPTFLPLTDEVTAIVPWKGNLLAGTKNSGLVLLDTGGHELARYHHHRGDPSSLGHDNIRSLLVDRNGNLWVGTARGLSVHAPSVWRMSEMNLFGGDHRQQPDLTFHALQQDPDGTIRISTSHGFFLVDGDRVRHVPLHNGELRLEVTGLFHLAEDLVYVGSETGLFRYAPDVEALDRSRKEFLPDLHTEQMYQVRSIHLDSANAEPKLLIGALGYTMEIVDPVTAAWALLPDEAGFKGSDGDMMRCTQRDGKGTYWTATLHGVAHWSLKPGLVPAGRERYAMGAPGDLALPGNDASSLIIHNDTVWVALRDAGLASIVKGAARSHTPPSHMSHDALGVAIDRSGRAWATTSDGLLCFDPHLRGQARTNGWLHIPVNDGIRFKQLNKCILTLHDGSIALCADNSIIRFDPSDFTVASRIPDPYLVEVRSTWGLLSTDEDLGIAISYRSSAFEAVMTALSPVGGTPLVFAYRLEGVETEWRTTDARTPIRYAGVPVGDHRLQVRVRDAYGREGTEHVLLTVTVNAPFWQRWWFFALVLAAGAGSMYALSRLRQRQRLKLQGVRDRIARDLHDDIGSTLGSISYYSEALKRKLGSIDDPMAQQVADKIGSSSREMIDQMSDIVWSVDPKNDDAGSLVQRMQGFAGDLLAAKGIALHFKSDATMAEVKLSSEQRRNLFLIFKEAMHNSVKYAQCANVHVEARNANGSLVLEVRDDGKGFEPNNTDSYNGNGLPNMRARAAAIRADLAIESAPGRGTSVRTTARLKELLPCSGD